MQQEEALHCYLRVSRLSPLNDGRLIRDNSVHPCIIQIPIWYKMNLEVFLGGVNLIDRGVRSELILLTGKRLFGEYRETVFFLASDESTDITGSEFFILGGVPLFI